MQIGRHAQAVIDRVVVPQEGRAPELFGDARQMAGRQLAAADFGAGPEDVDPGIERAAEVFQIAGRAGAEDAVENRIVGVVGRTHDDVLRLRPFRNPVDDLRLRVGEVRKIASHVVEQDGKRVGPERVEARELGGQCALHLGVEAAIDLVGAEPNAEAHARVAAVVREVCEPFDVRGRMRLAPAPAQEFVGLGRVDIEAVAVGRESGDRVPARVLAPRRAVIAFDDTERRHQTSILSAVPSSARR